MQGVIITYNNNIFKIQLKYFSVPKSFGPVNLCSKRDQVRNAVHIMVYEIQCILNGLLWYNLTAYIS